MSRVTLDSVLGTDRVLYARYPETLPEVSVRHVVPSPRSGSTMSRPASSMAHSRTDSGQRHATPTSLRVTPIEVKVAQSEPEEPEVEVVELEGGEPEEGERVETEGAQPAEDKVADEAAEAGQSEALVPVTIVPADDESLRASPAEGSLRASSPGESLQLPGDPADTGVLEMTLFRPATLTQDDTFQLKVSTDHCSL